MLLTLPKSLLKQWIAHSGNGYFSIENEILSFISNSKPIFKVFNVFGLAALFHDLNILSHVDFVTIAFSCKYSPPIFRISKIMSPTKHFNLSPNSIFQLPRAETINLDFDDLPWSPLP